MAMPTAQEVPLVSHAIQLAVAPVFLLTGIAGLLGVMANRLARVIDRARSIEQAWTSLDAPARDGARAELASLERRRRLASWSINSCTAAALLICVVIVALFVEEIFELNLRLVAAGLFTLSMVAVIAGLAAFLREVWLATHATIIDAGRFAASTPPPRAGGERSPRRRD
jgi:small-conductance mechanosensitive channel